MEPKVAKVSPNAPPMVPKLVQSRPNCPPGCLCGAKVVPKSPPRVPKRRPRSPQAPPASPKWSHKGPKGAKNASQERPTTPQSAKPSGGYPNWLIKEWGNHQIPKPPASQVESLRDGPERAVTQGAAVVPRRGGQLNNDFDTKHSDC